MKAYPQIDTLLDQAENARRCAHSSDPLIQKGLYRRYRAGDLARPYPGLFTRAEYWHQLNEPEQSLHMARALRDLHPNWVFSGITAAAAHGFDHPRILHRQGLTITLPSHGSYRPHEKLNIIYSPCPREKAVIANGIAVTNPSRTLLDCGRTIDFVHSLPIFDDAASNGIEEKQILQECARTTLDCSRIFKLLRYTDARSENGGESFARAVMIENGFSVPQLQVPFTDPLTGKQFRVDFLWRTADGRIIVGELDGTAKYVDPQMTDRKSIQETVQAEREREQALFRAGVTEIVRFTFDDAVRQKPLIAKLRRAGVPCVS
ncbi:MULTISPECIES: type IV toxin-antitoxin system AbiEi family antitoxin domain-containing protein [Bifidobacterium]|uniref:type IV toxin-antitoxin system AbiEi family antitoxin domain-containing protein n=1 Tax=Bifidobacterium TaxID=1678 RepID=UPI000C1498EC|nr:MULTISPECIES: hypothetical protein [unclassified Bifidobacterium]PIB85690.1 hypothetical protein CE153_02995 [Bifidobacterium sp. N4G05]